MKCVPGAELHRDSACTYLVMETSVPEQDPLECPHRGFGERVSLNSGPRAVKDILQGHLELIKKWSPQWKLLSPSEHTVCGVWGEAQA